MVKCGIKMLTICIILLVGSCGIVNAEQIADGTLGYTTDSHEKYTPYKSSINQPELSFIRLGVWWPRYEGDLPPYGDLALAGIEAIDVVDLNASTLQNLDVVYIGRGAFYVHGGEGDMDVDAVKEWVSNGGAIIGESESVIYDSVVTLGVDWSPQLSYVFGVWSNEADGADYGIGNITITLDPEHPISNGLPTIFSTTVYSIEDAAYLDTTRNPTAEEVGTVASSRPGIPPIIASNYGSGRAVYFPYCPDWSTNWSSVGGQNLEKLFINAVKWTVGTNEPTVSISTDKSKYSPGDTMVVTLDITNPSSNPVTFEWYIGVPQSNTWVTYASVPIPPGYSNTHTIPIPVGNWGPSSLGLVHYVHILESGTEEVLAQGSATFRYSTGSAVTSKVNIAKEIMKTKKKAELPI